MDEQEYLLLMFASLSALMFVSGFVLVINMVY
jgi:hypothetical protein